MRKFIHVIIIFFILFGSWKSFELYGLQKEQKHLKEVYAEINKINYGLFNLQLWKDKAMEIFQKEIDEFSISPQVYTDVERELNNYLNQLYYDYIASGKLVNDFVDEAVARGDLNKLFAKLVRENVPEMLKGMRLKEKIPLAAQTLTQELKSNEPKLKGYLQEGLTSMLFDENPENFFDPREAVYRSFGQPDLESTNLSIKNRIVTLDTEIDRLIKIVYALILLSILLSFIFYNHLKAPSAITLITASSIVLLLLGVTMPMIDIDARLNAFRMSVVGNEISFDEQFMYYQSKSILEVTETLIRGGGVDLKIVGILILMFSIVVPLIKLILSAFFLFNKKIRQSSVVKGIIYHLGKWSMADVFVVAMFMAYIGFYGLVTSQLTQIERNETGFAVETLNYSKLAPGALFFTTYCILSIITGILAKKWYDEKIDN